MPGKRGGKLFSVSRIRPAGRGEGAAMFAFALRLLALIGSCSMAGGADLEREIVFAPHTGAAAEDIEIGRWQVRAQGREARAEDFERLAWAYVAKARRTLDAGFYTLAQKTAELLERQFGATAETRLLRGHVLHQQHRFSEAETVARGLVEQRGAPADLALLSDVLIEQGKLGEGIRALERLAVAKPGVESFSRIAHVRWLKGDLEGALEATGRALKASAAADGETRAWLLVRLSGLHLQRGDAAQAQRLAAAALKDVTDYPPALLARGRALIAERRPAEAVVSLARAAALHPLPEYQWWLADAMQLLGRGDEAREVERQLVRGGAKTDPRTLALFLATRRTQLEWALQLSRRELAERKDIFSHDALAWAAAAAGDLGVAQKALAAALVEGTRDARLFLHAGEISRAAGQAETGARYFRAAAAMAGTLTPSERALLDQRLPELTGASISAPQINPKP
jgi:tetratricopeptide (TPR) repeat protein